ILARREETAAFETMVNCLSEGNQPWARLVPVLMISFAKRHFTKNGKPNRVAVHDVGAASQLMSVQAAALGLQIHQMAGIEIEKIRSTYGVPEEFEPVAGVAIGYPGQHPDLPADFAKRDEKARTRNAFDEFVFSESWEKAAKLR